jgi:hypothetical protein
VESLRTHPGFEDLSPLGSQLSQAGLANALVFGQSQQLLSLSVKLGSPFSYLKSRSPVNLIDLVLRGLTPVLELLL